MIQWNLYKATTQFCGFSRQVVSHDRENKHDFLQTLSGKWWNLCDFDKNFPRHIIQVPLYHNFDSKRENLMMSYLFCCQWSLGQLRSLENLDVQHNMLLELPSSVCQLKHLLILQVAHNRLCDLPEHLGRLTRLQEISARLEMKKIK